MSQDPCDTPHPRLIQPVPFLSKPFEVWLKCTKAPLVPQNWTPAPPEPSARPLCHNSLVQMEYLGASPLTTFPPFHRGEKPDQL